MDPALATPSLVVDLDVLEENVEDMARRGRQLGVALRPHAKTHKSPDLARLQLDAGAVGLTVATVSEAEVFAEAGFTDLFIAYPLWVDPEKGRRLRALADLGAVFLVRTLRPFEDLVLREPGIALELKGVGLMDHVHRNRRQRLAQSHQLLPPTDQCPEAADIGIGDRDLQPVAARFGTAPYRTPVT